MKFIKQGYAVLVVIVLLVIITLLTIRNDNHFNEERTIELRKKIKCDSLINEQTETLPLLLKEVTARLDSICCDQRRYNEIWIRDDDSIKTSLDQIKKTGQRMIYLMK